MADYNNMGGLPAGYGDLLNSARQQLVRMPDGTLSLRPQFGAGTSLDDIYGGILPPQSPSQALISRNVNTVPIDTRTWNPVAQRPGFVADTMSTTRNEQSGARPAVTVGVQPAGTVQMPPGARPSILDQMFAGMGPTAQPGMFGRGIPAAPRPPTQTAQAPNVWDGFNPNTPKSQDHLPANDGGEAGFLSAFGPQTSEGNAALEAIDQLTGSGRSTLTPFPMPYSRSPVMPAGSPGSAPRALMPLTPSANLRNSSSNGAIGNNYTIRKGDTLSGLAKSSGISIAQIMAMNPQLSDPNRIRAGTSLNLGTLVPDRIDNSVGVRVDGKPNMIYRRVVPPAPSNNSTRARQLAEGRNSQIDEWGNIR